MLPPTAAALVRPAQSIVMLSEAKHLNRRSTLYLAAGFSCLP